MKNRKYNKYQNIRNDRNSYFNNTSEAYKYAPEYDYAPLSRPTRKIIKKQKTKYVVVEKTVKLYSAKIVFCSLIFATFALTVVCIEALSIHRRFDITSLSNTLNEINENNQNLETELSKNLDLEYIEKIAYSELDMKKPASHQIIYIDVPSESYSETNNIEKNETLVSKIKSLFKK